MQDTGPLKENETSRLIKNKEDGTIEIREKLSEIDEIEEPLERKEVTFEEAESLLSKNKVVDEDRFAKILRGMDKVIEREREEEAPSPRPR